MGTQMILAEVLLAVLASAPVPGHAVSRGRDAVDRSAVASLVQCKPQPISAPVASPHFQFWWRHPTGRTAVPFQLHIARDGTVTDARILPGEYHRDFAVEALKALRSWKYKPLDCGPPDGIWVQSKMIFQAPEQTSKVEKISGTTPGANSISNKHPR